jgi:uroporphyrinogen III methyltransferase/synthase
LRLLLETRGARVLECPTIEIVPPDDWTAVDDAVRRLHTYNWLILTSTNAVDFFMERVAVAGVQCELPIAVVGEATASRLASWSLKAALVPRNFRAEGLLESFAQNLDEVRILLPRAQEGREMLPEELRRRGAVVDVVPVYRTVKAGREKLKYTLESGKADCVVFTSPSTIDREAGEILRNVTIAVIGPVTRHAAEAAGLKPAIEPERATVKDLAAAIAAYYERPV